MATTEKTQYEGFAAKYDSVEDLPCAQLEAELVQAALGNCTGIKVLDLGGGSGLHARKAADAGAAVVDVVDVSAAMMQIGKDIETKFGREGIIRWHEADVSKPLTEQGISVLHPGQYDIVLANWVFDHATSLEDLKGMWHNIAVYVRPGGKFLGVRVANPRAECVQDGKYGVRFENVEQIPDGVRYQVVCLTEPPFAFEATSMEASYTLDHDIPRQLGFVDIGVLSPEDTGIVKGNQEFWRIYLEDPHFVLVTARKG
jgi:SAM-dependent methyltransferase